MATARTANNFRKLRDMLKALRGSTRHAIDGDSYARGLASDWDHTEELLGKLESDVLGEEED